MTGHPVKLHMRVKPWLWYVIGAWIVIVGGILSLSANLNQKLAFAVVAFSVMSAIFSSCLSYLQNESSKPSTADSDMLKRYSMSKWVIICAGVIGAVSPGVVFYASTESQKESEYTLRNENAKLSKQLVDVKNELAYPASNLRLLQLDFVFNLTPQARLGELQYRYSEAGEDENLRHQVFRQILEIKSNHPDLPEFSFIPVIGPGFELLFSEDKIEATIYRFDDESKPIVLLKDEEVIARFTDVKMSRRISDSKFSSISSLFLGNADASLAIFKGLDTDLIRIDATFEGDSKNSFYFLSLTRKLDIHDQWAPLDNIVVYGCKVSDGYAKRSRVGWEKVKSIQQEN